MRVSTSALELTIGFKSAYPALTRCSQVGVMSDTETKKHQLLTTIVRELIAFCIEHGVPPVVPNLPYLSKTTQIELWEKDDLGSALADCLLWGVLVSSHDCAPLRAARHRHAVTRRCSIEYQHRRYLSWQGAAPSFARPSE